MKYALKPIALACLGLYSVSSAETLQLRVIETTDLHANMMDFNYYRGKTSPKLGLVRAATLVKQAQDEVKNSVLVDNGDLIQGSPMGDYVANKGLKVDEVHPIYKAMNMLNYEVGNIGNHEFNYGLDFLKESINDANFPYISANVFDAKTGEHYFKPYLIKTYKFVDTEGKEQQIKVGYIGFVPPQITTWDKKNLEGKVISKDIKETAEKLVPEMKAKGADVIVAIPHSGLSSKPYEEMAEDSVYYLTEVEGIDAIAFGHAHAVFPSKKFADIPNVDLEKGSINGVASVMPGRWGSHIGLMDLTLTNDSGKWQVSDAQTTVRAVYDSKNKVSLAQADEAMREVLKVDHENTLEFVNQPIGKATAPMYSFLALVQDDPTVQIVNLAQKDYVERFIQGDPDYADIPVISAAAPFKAGGRKNDPSNYVEVEAGTLAFKNAADLYLYSNTLVALKLSGAEVKDWLACSAGQFNQIDPKSKEKQTLINWSGFPTYNFDVMDGVSYQIDITQPAKYDKGCKVVNEGSERITNLTFNGKPVDPKQAFIVATNNYRAYGNKFAGTDKDHLVFASPDENRTILAEYIKRISKENGAIETKADNNWSFKTIDNADADLTIVFETADSAKAQQFIKENSVHPVKKIGNDDIGFAEYTLDLSTKK